jgi:Flp pilus assembly protein protease CpaA
MPAPGWRQRFGVIIAFVLATLIGLPLANALMGEVAAMVLAAFIGGFALGRMTLKKR